MGASDAMDPRPAGSPVNSRLESSAEWLATVLGRPLPAEGGVLDIGKLRFVMRDGILREEAILSERQSQTADVFSYKWRRGDTFDTSSMMSLTKEWLGDKYGEVATAPWWSEYGSEPLVVDVGCGAALSALELFGARLEAVRYLGVDVSDAVEAAAARFEARGLLAAFLQADLSHIPLGEGTVDVLFSEGVLHHTDSTEDAVKHLSRLLKPGGRFLFYVYRQKAPVREFTDDLVRERLHGLSPEEAWAAVMPLTRLGKALGDLDAIVDVPEDIPILGIPAGRVKVQRLIYWYFCKAFFRADLSIHELNHINFDWYAPRNAHRQTPEQVRAWCQDANLRVEREHLQESGITIVAQKR